MDNLPGFNQLFRIPGTAPSESAGCDRSTDPANSPGAGHDAGLDVAQPLCNKAAIWSGVKYGTNQGQVGRLA